MILNEKTKIGISILLVAIVLFVGCSTQEMVMYEPQESASVPPTHQFGNFDFTPLPLLSVEEYIPHLATEIANYNRIAHLVWYNNPMLNISFLVKDTENERFWFIEPDGSYQEISEQQAHEDHGFLTTFALFWEGEEYTTDSGAFWYSDIHDADGVILFLQTSHAEMLEKMGNRYAGFTQPHRGDANYVLFAFGIHEAFHVFHQARFADDPNLPSNLMLDNFLEDFDARLARHMILLQMLEALADIENEAKVLDLLASYVYYKENWQEDHLMAMKGDRFEGSAFYFEVVSSLLSTHDEYVTSLEDIPHVVAQIASYALDQVNLHGNIEIWMNFGLQTEGYYTGLVGFLLNQYMEPDIWQSQIENDPQSTFFPILLAQFAGRQLPPHRVATRYEAERLSAAIDRRIQYYAELAAYWDAIIEEMMREMEDDEE